jgi:hypothetical protein
MRKHLTSLVLGSFWALVCVTGSSAQVEPAKGREGLRADEEIQLAADDFPAHGKKVRVRSGDKVHLEGTFVRGRDIAGGRVLYVRTRPGALPVAWRTGAAAAGDAPGRAPIFVLKGDPKPEISTMTIRQGPISSTSYSSDVLSPEEKVVLVSLDSAEQEVAQLQMQSLLRSMNLAAADAILIERLKTQQLLNLSLGQQLTAIADPTFPLVRFGSPFLGIGLGGLDAYTAIAASQVAAAVPVPARPPAEAIADSLAKARRELLTVQTRAIYENGRIVAVSVEMDKKPDEKGK